jgi:heparan-sulfate lyase
MGNKLLFLLVLSVCFLTSCSNTGKTQAGSVDFSDNAQLLLSRLDMESPGLERVKALSTQPESAVKELLAFYRKGGTGKHPLNKSDRKKMRNKSAGEKEMKMADDAMNHYFIGQGSYPPQFCGEDIDWASNPFPDNEWIWQLHRMSFWNAMGAAYWHTGDEKYAKEFAKQFLDWYHKNPQDKQHAYAWRTIEAGIRGCSWMQLFQRFVDSPSFTPEVLSAFLNSCHDHASLLMTKYSTGSNWGLMEAEGMAFIAIIFPQFKDAVKWRDEAFRRLVNETKEQVYPDGHQRELTIGYHTGCIDWFLRTYKLAKLNGLEKNFPDAYLETIEKMCEVAMKMSLPDGTNAPFGDAWQGKPGQYDDSFREWAAFFDRKDFLYLATHGKEGETPGKTGFALPQSGIYSMRSGWDSSAVCLVLKCGPDGGWHCQPDNGTFDLYAGGKNLMPDGGSYIYSGNPEGREWFRQTKVHKTLTLDNRNSNYEPRLLLWDENNDILVVENRSYGNLTHRRAVIFVDRQYFVLIDEALGSDKGQLDLHFQLAPGDVLFDEKKQEVRSAIPGSWNVAIRPLPQTGMTLEKEEGQVSFVYNQKEPRPAFCYRLNKTSGKGARFVTVLIPFADTCPDVEVVFPDDIEIGSSSIRFTVAENKKPKEISYTF